MLALTIPRLNDAGAPQGRGGEPDWSLSATVIETCSCPVFCQCYFNTFPAAHVGHDGHGKTERFCRFNRALKINRGSLGKTQLDGVKFWMAGDLGGDFSHEEYDWAALTFEPSVTKDQRDAIVAIIPHLFPGRWNSFTVEKDAVLEWKQTKDHAEARLDGGKIAEVMLRKAQGRTDRNDGFILMPNEIEAYRAGDKPFEFKGTNGFVTTIDMSSKDVRR